MRWGFWTRDTRTKLISWLLCRKSATVELGEEGKHRPGRFNLRQFQSVRRSLGLMGADLHPNQEGGRMVGPVAFYQFIAGRGKSKGGGLFLQGGFRVVVFPGISSSLLNLGLETLVHHQTNRSEPILPCLLAVLVDGRQNCLDGIGLGFSKGCF